MVQFGTIYFKKNTMKQILTILLILSATVAMGQYIGAGEYATIYVKDGVPYQTVWQGLTPVTIKHPITGVIHADGGQYHAVATTNTGDVYTFQGSSGVMAKIGSGAQKAYGFYTSTIILSTAGTLRQVGSWFANSLLQPAGKVFTKIAISGTSSKALSAIYALTTQGEIYRYTTGAAVLVGTGYTDVTAVGINAIVGVKANEIIYLNGYYASYVGLNYGAANNTKIPFSGKFPLREAAGSYNTLHVIDADGNLWGVGSNVMGEVGNGIGKEFWGTQWDWGNGQLLTSWVQIPGKWQNLQGSNNIAFYKWVQDDKGQWYSWGRNKAFSLGNQITLSVQEYATYPNYLDVWKPTPVDPFGTWQVVKYNATVKPVAPLPVVVPPAPATVLKSYHDSVVVAMELRIANEVQEKENAQKAASYLSEKLKAIIDILNK